LSKRLIVPVSMARSAIHKVSEKKLEELLLNGATAEDHICVRPSSWWSA
jgi:hypothetical protein